MSDAPETIWAAGGHYWHNPTFKRDKTEYRRADLVAPASLPMPITPAQIMADPRVQALVEAGEVMAKALRGDYIVPGSAKAWDAALAQLKEPKVKELLNVPTMQ